jgi:methyl-accepting chemotaxis protein
MILLITASISIFIVNNDMEDLANETLSYKLSSDINALNMVIDKTYGKLKYIDDQLVKEDGTMIRGDYDLIDRIGKELSDLVTIFEVKGDDFERITTNIIKEDGSRAVGTMLGTDSAAYDSLVNKKRFLGNASILGENYLTVYDPIVIDNKIVGIMFVGVKTRTVEEIIGRSLNKFLNSYAVILVITLLIAIIITYIIGSKLSKPLKDITKISMKLGKGNLNIKLNKKLLDNPTEIGELSKGFEAMRVNLKKLIGEIQSISHTMVDSSGNLNKISSNTVEAGSEVEVNINEISQGAMEQAKNTEDGTQAVVLLGELIESNSSILDETKIVVQKFLQLSEAGLNTMERLKEKNEESIQANNQIALNIESTQESSNKISAASELILSIADQTNLLALNAAIEAARAGEMGKGFAVVAEEIRKLAEESKRSSEEIRVIITELEENSKKAKDTAIKSSETMKEQTYAVSENSQVFKGIYDILNNLRLKFGDMEQSSTNMIVERNHLLDVMQNLSAIAEENAASSEEVSATVVEIIEAMNVSAKYSNELNTISESLNEKVDGFKV